MTLMRYHEVYYDFRGTDLHWVQKIVKQLSKNEWDHDTPLLIDGNNWDESIRDTAVQYLLQSLRKNVTVNTLILRYLTIALDTEVELSKAFFELNALTSITISDIQQQHNEGPLPLSLPSSLFTCCTLQDVTLSNCFINKKACYELSNLLRSKDCQMESLTLLDVTFEESSFIFIRDGIVSNKSLHDVMMKRIFLGSNDFQHLWYAFSKNTSIHVLKIEEMEFNNQQAEHIAKFLVNNNNLSSLSLKKNKLNASAIQTIMTVGLPSNKTLKTLHLSDNPIGDAGAVFIVTGLTMNSTLQDLCLSNCNIHDTGCKILSRALGSFSGLLYLNMKHNSMDTYGTDVLKSLSKNWVIQSILHDNFIQQEKEMWRTVEQNLYLNRMNRKFIKQLHASNTLCGNFLSQSKVKTRPDILFQFLLDLVPVLAEE